MVTSSPSDRGVTMNAMIGLALALVVGAGRSGGHSGTNGLDPSVIVYVTGETPESLVIDPGLGQGRLHAWLEQGGPSERPGRENALKYFIACAFDDTVTVSLDTRVWRGRFGLAPGTQANALTPGPKGKGRHLTLTPDDGKWVSACMMAHANTLGLHEYVSLRGNPSAWKGWPPSPGERWAMSYTEGVFFADVLNLNFKASGAVATAPTSDPAEWRAVLERSFTQSLNLPTGCETVRTWMPPNHTLGRRLDYDRETSCDVPKVGRYHCARKLGPFDQPIGQAGSVDPDHALDRICVTLGDDPEVIDCSEKRKKGILFPLFVHLPRLVRFESATPTRDATRPIQVIVDKAPEKGGGGSDLLRRRCRAGDGCMSNFFDASVDRRPVCPSTASSSSAPPAATGFEQANFASQSLPPGMVVGPLPGAVVAGHLKDQILTVVLRLTENDEKRNLALDPGERFTAIVRYRSNHMGLASVEVQTKSGWVGATGIWPLVQDDEFQWLQVYPVMIVAEEKGGPLALSIRIRGLAPAAKDGRFLDLDVAGFVPGAPWCMDDVPIWHRRRAPPPGGAARISVPTAPPPPGQPAIPPTLPQPQLVTCPAFDSPAFPASGR